MSQALLARDLVVRCIEVDLLLADARVALQGKPNMSDAAVCIVWSGARQATQVASGAA